MKTVDNHQDWEPDLPLTIPDLDVEAETPESGAQFLARAVWNIITTIVPAVLLALFVNLFVAQAMVIQGPSMQPTLHYNQRVLVEKLTYHFFHGPRRGDVVVIEVEEERDPLIKRVVALPGETIEVHNGQVMIDGEPLEEPWPTRPGGPGYGPTRVPELHVFVLGDNRGSSRDSRSFGAVPVSHIIGQAWLVYWPLSDIKLVR